MPMCKPKLCKMEFCERGFVNYFILSGPDKLKKQSISLTAEASVSLVEGCQALTPFSKNATTIALGPT